PGGWNTTPQPAAGSSSRNNIPTGGVRQASAEVPLGYVTTADDEPVRVQTDEHNLRFAQQAPPQPVNQIASTWSSPIQSQPGFSQEITPTSVYPGQLTGYQAPVAQPRPVQIRALPPNQPTTGGFVSPVTRDGFRPQGSSRSRTSALATPPGSSTSGFGPTREGVNRYGYDPNYQWLRGQLEYSEATHQWKLRYIPIQQNPDQFGGSVLIANPEVLGGVRSGDHVQLRGRLHTRGNSGQAFVPIYTVSVVQRQQI
ncbi:MAG: hypothetical protein MI725_01655, partial [Pirellulales bacterium]|nr:hypothetical protein [Pirellulales bacterium]